MGMHIMGHRRYVELGHPISVLWPSHRSLSHGHLMNIVWIPWTTLESHGLPMGWSWNVHGVGLPWNAHGVPKKCPRGAHGLFSSQYRLPVGYRWATDGLPMGSPWNIHTASRAMTMSSPCDAYGRLMLRLPPYSLPRLGHLGQ